MITSESPRCRFVLVVATIFCIFTLPAAAATALTPAFGDQAFYGIDASTGDLYHWGKPQAYDYSSSDSQQLLIPTLFSTGPYVSVSSGNRHACALRKDDGKVVCWGASFYGELGNGELESQQDTPTPILSDLTFVQLSVGSNYACGITAGAERRLFCWGDGDMSGALGNGENTPSSIPVEESGNYSDWQMVSVSTGGDHVCGIRLTANSLYCWGSNISNEISPDDQDEYLTPHQVPGQWRYVSAGASTTLAIDIDGNLYGWGNKEVVDFDYAEGGMLGDNSTMCYNPETEEFCPSLDEFDGLRTNQKTPVMVAGNRTWSYVSAGRIPCAIEADTGKLFCWGYTTGEAFIEGSPDTNYPKEVPLSTIATNSSSSKWAVVQVSGAGGRCAVLDTGEGYCWGRNSFSCDDECPLGDGTGTNSGVPVKVAGGNGSWLVNSNSSSSSGGSSSNVGDVGIEEEAQPPLEAEVGEADSDVNGGEEDQSDAEVENEEGQQEEEGESKEDTENGGQGEPLVTASEGPPAMDASSLAPALSLRSVVAVLLMSSVVLAVAA